MECWICLAGEGSSPFSSFCGCSPSVRPVHARCLGRWQLQRAGTREETHCRFCNSKYSLDWRASLSGPNSTDSSQEAAPVAQTVPPAPRRPPTPIMAIIFEGQIHRIKVYPGPEGKARFQQQIRDLVQLGEDEEFEVEFECKAPDSGAVLHLDGMDAFDAATHCAALTAAERLTRHKQHRHGNNSSNNNSSSEHQQQGGSRQQQGATADVQLQVAAQHSTGNTCPSGTAMHCPTQSPTTRS